MSGQTPVMFSSAVEGLLLALGDQLDEATRARFKAAGVDLDRKLSPEYPVETWIALVEIACARVAPGVPINDACLRLGRMFFEGYRATFVGRALTTVARILGPQRTLEKMAGSIRTANNFSQVRLTRRAPGDYELWCQPVTWPGWYQGMFAAALESSGGKHVQVTVLKTDPDRSATFGVSWS